MSANTQSLAMTKVYQIVPTALHTANTSTYSTGKKMCTSDIEASTSATTFRVQCMY